VTSGWTIGSLSEAIRRRDLSIVEIVHECLQRIEADELRAFVTLRGDSALEVARLLDSELHRGQYRGPLHGIPLAHKDLLFIEGMPTSCGTSVKNYFEADRTATVITRLVSAGSVTLGKLNMTELAMSPFGDNAAYGDVRNPWSHRHSAGGSSSGSAAAVAGGLVFGSIGSDTGGSIRQPAAYCGVVGIKPTYGRVSRAGAMPLSWSLDHIGPIARTVRDAALLLNAIAGEDTRDTTSSSIPVEDYLRGIDASIAGIRIGVPQNYHSTGLEPELEAAVFEAGEVIARLGGRLVQIAIPDPGPMNSASSLITRSEGCAIHGAFAQGHPDVLASTIRSRLELGYQISAYDYLQAQRLRVRLARAFVDDVFEKVDMILMPVAPGVAPRLKDLVAGTIEVQLERMGHLTSLTRLGNGLGLPAISVPCGFSTAGLPFAFQLVGRPFGEAAIIHVAHCYEQECGWWNSRPS
jgi:aspartyl-tRNA(Asn)/glutamyl-tRNA(Gln) amidotransferase subunit A